jgi:integrase
MATFTKRGNSTRAQVRMGGHPPLSATFDTETEARDWAEKIEARIKRGEAIVEDELGENPTVISLMRRYVQEVSVNKRRPSNDVQILRRLEAVDVFKKRVSNFGSGDLRAWRDARIKGDPARKIAPVTSGTCLRELNLVSVTFSHAIKEWSLPLRENPCSQIKWPAKNKSRRRRVSDEEVEALMTICGWDCVSVPTTGYQWLAWCVQFALATAMRRGEIASMTWGNVHKAARYVHLPMTKNGHERNVPLRKAAFDLIELLPEGEPGERVIDISENTITAFFWEMTREIGLTNLRFHDLRHEATTRIAKMLRPRGGVDDVSVLKLAAITGHESLQMLKIYFNPTAQEMAVELDRLDALE